MHWTVPKTKLAHRQGRKPGQVSDLDPAREEEMRSVIVIIVTTAGSQDKGCCCLGSTKVRAGKAVCWKTSREFGSSRSSVSTGRKSCLSPCARFVCNIWVFPWIFLSKSPASLPLTQIILYLLNGGAEDVETYRIHCKAVCKNLMVLVPFQCLLCCVLRADCIRRQ